MLRPSCSAQLEVTGGYNTCTNIEICFSFLCTYRVRNFMHNLFKSYIVVIHKLRLLLKVKYSDMEERRFSKIRISCIEVVNILVLFYLTCSTIIHRSYYSQSSIQFIKPISNIKDSKKLTGFL